VPPSAQSSVLRIVILVVPHVLGLVHTMRGSQVARIRPVAMSEIAFICTLMAQIYAKSALGHLVTEVHVQSRRAPVICGHTYDRTLTAIEVLAVPVLAGQTTSLVAQGI
jgi:hypothetical protein